MDRWLSPPPENFTPEHCVPAPVSIDCKDRLQFDTYPPSGVVRRFLLASHNRLRHAW